MHRVDPAPAQPRTASWRPAPPGVRGRAGSLLLASLLALATVLGLQVAHPSTAAAATGPTVVDDSVEVPVSTFEVVLPGAQNDRAGSSAIQRGLTVFAADQPSALPPGSSVSDKLLYDSGFGTWKIAGDGRMTFDTTAHVTGTRSVRYRITDAGGLSAEGLATVTVTAGAGADLITTTQGTSATIDQLANDTPGRDADGSPGTLDRSSLRFRAAQGAPVTVSSNGLVVTFPKVGVFSIDPTSRLTTFTPDPAYVTVNDSYALYYTAQDTTRGADGTEHHAYTGQLRWDVTAYRLSVSEKASPALFFHVGDTITWTTMITNHGSTPLTGLGLTHSLGARILTQTCTPVALGGTLGASSSTTCTATSRARQQDFDAEAARIDDTVVATATATQDGRPLPVRTQSGASTVTRITQGLALTATTSPTSVSSVGQRVAYSFVARNKGNRSLRDLVVSDPAPGLSALVCAPVALGGSLGEGRTTTCTATQVLTAADLQAKTLSTTAKATAVPVSGAHPVASNAAVTASVTVTGTPPTVPPAPPAGPAPVAAPDVASTTVGHPVVVAVLADDRPGSSSVPLDGTSVRLRTGAALPAGSALSGDAKTLKVAGRGVFLVAGTGQITFVPLGAATGPVPTVGYQVADAAGTTARTTLAVTVGE